MIISTPRKMTRAADTIRFVIFSWSLSSTELRIKLNMGLAPMRGETTEMFPREKAVYMVIMAALTTTPPPAKYGRLSLVGLISPSLPDIAR